MKYMQTIQAAHDAPEQLEQIYRDAQRDCEAGEFIADMLACYKEFPENVLYAAWYQRVQHSAQEDQVGRKRVNWKLAVPLGILGGVPLFLLSGNGTVLALYWAPIIAFLTIVFLDLAGKRNHRRCLLISAGLVIACIYVALMASGQGSGDKRRYMDLMNWHLLLLAWAGVGLSLLGRGSSLKDRFAFLSKSIEVFVTAGIYLIACAGFFAITFGMFEALNVFIPDAQDVIIFSAGGLSILAVAGVYDPSVSPSAQEFERGLGKLIATLMRLLLPLTVVVLVIYLCVIPFNFMAPFNNRRMLIVSNVVLFATMGLLLGAIPVRADGLSPKYQTALRAGILTVAILVVVVSLYALSAVLYRTTLQGITINRLAVIGWNSINIGILVLLIYKQFRYGRKAWLESLQSVFSVSAIGYIAWTIFLIVATPVLFRFK